MKWKSLLAAAAVWAVVGTPALRAQDAVQREIQRRSGREVSTREILDGLRSSGLPRAEVALRLQRQGLNPALADQYFDVLEGRALGTPEASTDFVAALEQMGIISTNLDEAALDASVAEVVAAQDAAGGAASEGGLTVFGKSVFASSSTRFDPLRMGPVAPDYLLGPDDQIYLVLTGDVELAHVLTVTREGSIVIPDVGQISVNGRTLSDLEDALYDRLGRVYSGVRRGPEATTLFDVSLGRLRTNQVFLIGEVESPGAYQISSVASTFNALYAAGGPTGIGSFREVFVRRRGNVVSTVDLYAYLVSGDMSDDMRLENGDVVFVPLSGPQVRVTGEVRRSAIYELKEGESLRDAIRFAGGLTAEGDPERIQVDRVLPAPERSGQVERRIMDVSLSDLPADSVATLHDGDVVRVFRIRDTRRHLVTLQGQVLRPGSYELLPGMTIWDLIRRAGGLLPDAFRPVAHVSRLNEADSTRTLAQVTLDEDQAGEPLQDLELVDQDLVTVFGVPRLRVPETVAIVGGVKDPDRYPLERGMTAEDLILLAGGFSETSDGLNIEVVRPLAGRVRSDTIGLSFSVALGGRVPWTLDATSSPDGPEASSFFLEDGDQVFVRPLPGFVRLESASVIGEVQRPGPYGLQTRLDRVSDFIARAGGLTPEAYVAGARLVRGGVPVGLDLARSLERPHGEDDLILEPGDRLEIPPYDGTVLVTGAVRVESRVAFRQGLSFADYLDRAGGVADEGDRGKAYIEYANGWRDVSGKHVWIIRHDPGVEPGSTIVVPPRPADEGAFSVDQLLTRTLAIMGTIATIFLTVDQLGR